MYICIHTYVHMYVQHKICKLARKLLTGTYNVAMYVLSYVHTYDLTYLCF